MPSPLSILVVTNIYPTASRPTFGVFVEQQVHGLREIGLQVNVLFVNRAEQGMRTYFKMTAPLRTAAVQARPALVHLMYGGVMADQVTRWNPALPKLVTFHGSDLLGENYSGLWRRWLSRYGVLASRRAARRAQGIVLVSERLRSFLPGTLDPAQIRVIPCGIDLNRFQAADKLTCQRQLAWDPHSFHVLFASNNGDPVKRPWLAAAAVEHLQHQGLRAELHRMERVPYAEVPLWLNASDALVLTSAQEGSPTVVKEALACGLPVVSVDVGDVAERIATIPGCHLAEPTPDALALKLNLVRQAGARVHAQPQLQALSIRTIALRLEQFYREILARQSVSSGAPSSARP
jgi:teichuronic acid biosynthesis glycosyltransferase TuaC